MREDDWHRLVDCTASNMVCILCWCAIIACDRLPSPSPPTYPLPFASAAGSTGKPKGVLHTTGGYMVWAATTFKYIFDTRPSAAHYAPNSPVKPDVHFCTADMGWVTGHSYM